MKTVGVDLIENVRIKTAIANHGTRFLNRVFTSREQTCCQGKITSLAARWAAKEAVSKAFGTGIGDVAFTDIEIINDDRGKPQVILHGNARILADHLGFTGIAVSLSHTTELAIALVMAE